METRLHKKEKDLSIALMLQKTLMSCYLCYQQGMQYLAILVVHSPHFIYRKLYQPAG